MGLYTSMGLETNLTWTALQFSQPNMYARCQLPTMNVLWIISFKEAPHTNYFLSDIFPNDNIMKIVPLEDDLVNINQFWWLFFLFLKIIENYIFQNIVQSENFLLQIWFISPKPVEHCTEKWEKNIWNSVLVTKCYQ